MSSEGQFKKEWLDSLLGELESPAAGQLITQELQKNICDHETYEELRNIVKELQILTPKESELMLDLTFEQKQELYSTLTDVFPEKKRSLNGFFPSLKLALFSGLIAGLVMASVPLVQWIMIPPKPQPIPQELDMWHEPAPLVFEQPEVVEPPKQEEKELEEIEFRPDINDLTYGPLAMNEIGTGYGDFTFEAWDGVIQEEILEIIDLDTAPSAIRQIAPKYPASMKYASVSGKVIVEFVIDETGQVRDAVVKRSTNREFEKPALDAIKRWKFEAGMKDGKHVKCRMRLPFVFNTKK